MDSVCSLLSALFDRDWHAYEGVCCAGNSAHPQLLTMTSPGKCTHQEADGRVQ